MAKNPSSSASRPAQPPAPDAAAPKGVEPAPVPPGTRIPFALRWFFSKTLRQAEQLRKHVARILSAQRDLLEPKAIEAVTAALTHLRRSARQGADPAALRQGMEKLEVIANKWLKSYPYPSLRENIEVFLVAIAVAMAIRTFFLQPFKIPTGSMQPTLSGITQEDLRDRPDVPIPNPIIRFINFWINGISYVHVVAGAPGELTYDEPTASSSSTSASASRSATRSTPSGFRPTT